MAKPKLNAGAAKAGAAPRFVLGSRPDAVRAPPPAAVQRIKPAKASTTQYGKVQKPMPAPPGAIQMGTPSGGGLV